jgi:hypothetical protein
MLLEDQNLVERLISEASTTAVPTPPRRIMPDKVNDKRGLPIVFTSVSFRLDSDATHSGAKESMVVCLCHKTRAAGDGRNEMNSDYL